MTRKKKKFTIFDFIVYFLLIIVFIITLYPFIFVFSMSVSSLDNVLKRSVSLLPKGFWLGSYIKLFKDGEIWVSYYNTIWYTVVGTTFTVIMTSIAGYVLSFKKLVFRRTLNLFFIITMYLSGGMIPSYLLVKALGMYNTRWAMVIPGVVMAYYIILARTFFESIPESLSESAAIDGAGMWTILLKIYLPLSKPIIAVLALYYAIFFWNNYFTALMYISDDKLKPLTLYLRRVLIQYSTSLQRNAAADASMAMNAGYNIQIKYACIIVAVIPIIMVYPYIQKYFVKGVMIGSVKG